MGFKEGISVESRLYTGVGEVVDKLMAGEQVSPLLVLEQAWNHVRSLSWEKDAEVEAMREMLATYYVGGSGAAARSILRIARIMRKSVFDLGDEGMSEELLREAIDCGVAARDYYGGIVDGLRWGNPIPFVAFAVGKARWSEHRGEEVQKGEFRDLCRLVGDDYVWTSRYWRLAATYAMQYCQRVDGVSWS